MKLSYGLYGPTYVKLGYRAADVIRKSGRPQPQPGSGDYHSRWDLDILRRESQAYDRDNGLYHGLIDRFLDNILGEHGFTLQARTSSVRYNRAVEKLWSEEFAPDPEIRGMDNWQATERKVLRHLVVDGDSGSIKTTVGKIQVVEAERIYSSKSKSGSNRIEGGIELDEVGRPVAFHVADYDANGNVGRNSRPIQAADFIFIANRDRISQTRGVPAMVSNFPMMHRINDVFDSEAAAWQLLSRLAVAVIRKDAEQQAYATSLEDIDAESPALATRYHDLGDAIMFHGEPGEDIRGIERNIPGANFTESVRMFLRLIGLPLGMPLELVLLDWSQTNYSSARASLLQAYRMFGRWQCLLSEKFHGPVYRWKVAEWIAAGKLPARDDAFAHEWVPPPFPWIDPLKDAQADGALMDRGQSTYGDVLKAQNRDRVDVIDNRATEIIDAINKAAEVKAATGKEVPWELFAGLEANKPGAPAKVEQKPTSPKPEAPDMPDAPPMPGGKGDTDAD